MGTPGGFEDSSWFDGYYNADSRGISSQVVENNAGITSVEGPQVSQTDVQPVERVDSLSYTVESSVDNVEGASAQRFQNEGRAAQNSSQGIASSQSLRVSDNEGSFSNQCRNRPAGGRRGLKMYGRKENKEIGGIRWYYRCHMRGCPVKERVDIDASGRRRVHREGGSHQHGLPPVCGVDQGGPSRRGPAFPRGPPAIYDQDAVPALRHACALAEGVPSQPAGMTAEVPRLQQGLSASEDGFWQQPHGPQDGASTPNCPLPAASQLSTPGPLFPEQQTFGTGHGNHNLSETRLDASSNPRVPWPPVSPVRTPGQRFTEPRTYAEGPGDHIFREHRLPGFHPCPSCGCTCNGGSPAAGTASAYRQPSVPPTGPTAQDPQAAPLLFAQLPPRRGRSPAAMSMTAYGGSAFHGPGGEGPANANNGSLEEYAAVQTWGRAASTDFGGRGQSSPSRHLSQSQRQGGAGLQGATDPTHSLAGLRGGATKPIRMEQTSPDVGFIPIPLPGTQGPLFDERMGAGAPPQQSQARMGEGLAMGGLPFRSPSSPPPLRLQPWRREQRGGHGEDVTIHGGGPQFPPFQQEYPRHGSATHLQLEIETMDAHLEHVHLSPVGNPPGLPEPLASDDDWLHKEEAFHPADDWQQPLPGMVPLLDDFVFNEIDHSRLYSSVEEELIILWSMFGNAGDPR